MSPETAAAYLAALALLAGAGAKAQEPTDAAGADPPELPSLGELEQRGAAIGRINLELENVFNLSNPGEDKRLYRWANRVHQTTRPSVVEDILLFESGEPLLEQVLAESARLLRERGFVADAEITASSYDPVRNTADVNVWMRDSWSLEPDLKYSRSGGENEYALGLVEDNMFGLGKSMTLSYSSDIDRDMRFFSYEDDNLFGSRKQLRAAIADLSDGRQFRFSAGRPFFSFDTRWSIMGETLDDRRVDSIYDLGEVIDEFRHDTRRISIYGGRSRGISDGVTKRWIAGLSFDENEFEEAPGFGPPLLLPENRRLIYPWAGFQWIGDDYRQVSELNDMGRIEDIALGLNLFARIGVASPELDSDRRAILVDFSADRGWEPLGPGSLALFSASAISRVEGNEYLNTVISLSGSFMRRNFGDELFLASLTTVFASKLDPENQVLLGGDNGLRGYPLRYQSGEQSALLSLEQRFYTDWYPFRLIRVGYAFFFDAGRVWGDDPRNTPNLGTLYDIGVGLRLTSPRSSGRAVVHLDLAFPINAPADIDDVQIVIEKRASF